MHPRPEFLFLAQVRGCQPKSVRPGSTPPPRCASGGVFVGRGDLPGCGRLPEPSLSAALHRVEARSRCAPRPWRTRPSRWGPHAKMWPRGAWHGGASAAAGGRRRTGEGGTDGGREGGPRPVSPLHPTLSLPLPRSAASPCLRRSTSRHRPSSTPAAASPLASTSPCHPARAPPAPRLTACRPAPPPPAETPHPTPPQVGIPALPCPGKERAEGGKGCSWQPGMVSGWTHTAALWGQDLGRAREHRLRGLGTVGGWLEQVEGLNDSFI